MASYKVLYEQTLKKLDLEKRRNEPLKQEIKNLDRQISNLRDFIPKVMRDEVYIASLEAKVEILQEENKQMLIMLDKELSKHRFETKTPLF